MTTTTSDPPARPARTLGGQRAWVAAALPLGLLSAVEGVVYQQPADRPILLAGRPDLRTARAVRLGRAGVVANQVADRRYVQCGHRRLAPPRMALACALVVMPVAAMCLSWQ